MSPDRNCQPLRVLLVGIDPVTSRALHDQLAADGDIVVAGDARDAPSALRAVSSTTPDIVLVDVDTPRTDAVSLTGQICGPSRVVLIAGHEDDDLALQGLLAGAAGFLPKSLTDGELRRALRGVSRGEAAVSRRLTTMLIDCLRGLGNGDSA